MREYQAQPRISAPQPNIAIVLLSGRGVFAVPLSIDLFFSTFEVVISEKKRVSDFDIQIGARLRLLREQHGISRSALARTLNISQQQVQKYEAGQNRIGAGLLPKLAHILGVPVSQFFEHLQDEGAIADPIEKEAGKRAEAILGLSAQCLAFIRLFVAIKDSNARSSVVALVRSLGGMEDEGEP